MRFSRDELLKKDNVLKGMAKTKLKTIFRFKAMKNRKMWEPEIAAIIDAQKVDDETLDLIREFDLKRTSFCELYCIKNEDGKPVIFDMQDNRVVIEPGNPNKVMGRYLFDAGEEEKLNKKVGELEKEERFVKLFEERKNREKEIYELLKGEVECDVEMFKLSELPEELTEPEIEALFDLVEQ